MKPPDLDDICEIIEEFIDLSGRQVTEDATFGTDIPRDSQQMLRVIARIEAAYRMRFAPQDLLSIRTVGDLLNVVRTRAWTA